MIMKIFLFLFVFYNSKSIYFNPALLSIYTDSIPVKNKLSIQKKTKSNAPFQGKRIFCSSDSDAKYVVTIKGNNVTIVTDNNRVTGVYKKDKLFTNDTREIEHRKFSPKYNYGSFYVIGADYFSVLNAENGEYRYYTLCE